MNFAQQYEHYEKENRRKRKAGNKKERQTHNSQDCNQGTIIFGRVAQLGERVKYTKERRNKISNRLKTKSFWYKDGRCATGDICAGCGKKMRHRYRKYNKCKPCTQKDPAYIASLSSSLKGKTGGYRVNSGNKRFHKSYYKKVWMDSSWELKFAKLCDANKIKWTRGLTIYSYVDSGGRFHKYHVDFYLPDTNALIEIIGYPAPGKEDKLNLVEMQNGVKILRLRSLTEIETFIGLLVK